MPKPHRIPTTTSAHADLSGRSHGGVDGQRGDRTQPHRDTKDRHETFHGADRAQETREAQPVLPSEVAIAQAHDRFGNRMTAAAVHGESPEGLGSVIKGSIVSGLANIGFHGEGNQEMMARMVQLEELHSPPNRSIGSPGNTCVTY